MTCYESSRKASADQALILGRQWRVAGRCILLVAGSVVGGRRVAGSAMHLPLIRWGGRTVALRAQQSGLQPSCSKHSVVAGLATAIAADLR